MRVKHSAIISFNVSRCGARNSARAGGVVRLVRSTVGRSSFDLIPIHVFEQVDGASFYLFSDGFNDQVGGNRGRGFGKQRMLDQLLRHKDQPMAAQREAILKAFTKYQGDETRRDDLTMVGFRL